LSHWSIEKRLKQPELLAEVRNIALLLCSAGCNCSAGYWRSCMLCASTCSF
jgi:hypothetical protein